MYDPINTHQVQFVVDERNRVTCAIVSGCLDDVQREMFSTSGMSIYFPTVNQRIRKSIQMPDKLKAIARCDPADEFDEKIGKDLAYARLKRKYWDKFGKRMHNAAALVDSFSCMLFAGAEKAIRRSESAEPLLALHRVEETKEE